MVIKNLLLGTAIGDAFGAGVEFQDRDWIRQNIDFTRFINVRHNIKVPREKLIYFTENYHAWDYTDDTEMTIGLIKALISNKTLTEDLLVEYWHQEYKDGEKKKGFGRNGHGSMSWFYAGNMSIEEVRSFQRPRPNPGNAPAMRAVPLGFIKENFINEYAAINANATHPNYKAVQSSQIIARASEFLLSKKGNEEDVILYCLDKINLDVDYTYYLKLVNQLPDYESLKNKHFKILLGNQPIEAPYFLEGIKGLPSDSKYTAGAVLYILKWSTDAFDALKKSIYLGGDVDSVASITTGIKAAKYGIKSLPKFMLENVEGKSYLEQIAKAFNQFLKL